jgi:hypothetical protein
MIGCCGNKAEGTDLIFWLEAYEICCLHSYARSRGVSDGKYLQVSLVFLSKTMNGTLILVLV